jgi:hypothetical protein
MLQGQEKLTLPVELPFLKSHFLSFKHKGIQYKVHEEIGMDDLELEEFLSLLEIDIHAEEYDVQYRRLIEVIKAKFNASNNSAENHLYNNALTCVARLASGNSVSERQITPEDFASKIDNSTVLYNEWFLRKKGENAYFRHIKDLYFSGLNILFSHRFFLVEVDPLRFDQREVLELVSAIVVKYCKVQKQETPFAPYVYFHNMPATALAELKSQVLRNGIYVLDGYFFKDGGF